MTFKKIISRNQTGIGLIEVLISLVVLSIGVMGTASLSMRSIQVNKGATDRSLAISIAQSMIETMRQHPKDARKNRYNTPFGGGAPDASKRYGREVETWLANIRAELPKGNGEIKCKDACRLSIRWFDYYGQEMKQIDLSVFI